jgi:hypothetical protein
MQVRVVCNVLFL